MVKNFYEVLEIDKNADERQIKSAYFSLVRKYAPDRFPEEFKKLRTAYETLSDPEKRDKYDHTVDLPGEAAFLFSQVQLARHENRFSDATELLKMIVRLYPELNNIKYELARAYEAEEKPGNAMKVWEELCDLEPENSAYSFKLARLYQQRGWRKKAIARLEKTVTLDPEFADAWMELIMCHEEGGEWQRSKQITFQAIGCISENRMGSLMLYASAFKHYIDDEEVASAERCLKAVVEMLKGDTQYPSDEQSAAACEIIRKIDELQDIGMTHYVRQIADLMPNLDERLRERLEKILDGTEIEALGPEGYPIVIIKLLMRISDGCDCENCANDVISLEASILSDLQGYKPHIERLRDEKNNQYKRHSVFFDEVLSTHYPEKLLNQRLKKLWRQDLEPNLTNAEGVRVDDYNAESAVEPSVQSGTYRREGPKVGRNDPCPCGSGKKYKKCCGA
ncbi:MAG: DnaJ domain-containing protein [Oscillospiraceae bacterium]|jgi:curved DNA-binding protein CbpA|nr:DnaJ domain-containing protein [Oscillospiraceae bacterium]